MYQPLPLSTQEKLLENLQLWLHGWLANEVQKENIAKCGVTLWSFDKKQMP